MNKKIKNKLVSIFSTILNIKAEKVNELFNQENESEWDSMNHLLLITEIEKEFKISIPIEESIKLTSFKEIFKFIKEIKNETTTNKYK